MCVTYSQTYKSLKDYGNVYKRVEENNVKQLIRKQGVDAHNRQNVYLQGQSISGRKEGVQRVPKPATAPEKQSTLLT